MTDFNDPHTGGAAGKSENRLERNARGQHRKPAIPTKSAQMSKLLRRPRGATMTELCAASNWQPHSVRALLSGLSISQICQPNGIQHLQSAIA